MSAARQVGLFPDPPLTDYGVRLVRARLEADPMWRASQAPARVDVTGECADCPEGEWCSCVRSDGGP